MTSFPVVLDEERLLVVDKPSGITSEDAATQLGMKLVHRIDKATSGLLVLAADARAVQRMQKLLASGGVERDYWLVAHGRLERGEISSTLVRDRGDGLRGSGPDGKPARTMIEILAHDASTTTACARLATGRTHQIRIHLAESGHPIVGEKVYVRDYLAARHLLIEAPRLMLHAWKLRFYHPMARREVMLECAPPIRGG